MCKNCSCVKTSSYKSDGQNIKQLIMQIIVVIHSNIPMFDLFLLCTFILPIDTDQY